MVFSRSLASVLSIAQKVFNLDYLVFVIYNKLKNRKTGAGKSMLAPFFLREVRDGIAEISIAETPGPEGASEALAANIA